MWPAWRTSGISDLSRDNQCHQADFHLLFVLGEDGDRVAGSNGDGKGGELRRGGAHELSRWFITAVSSPIVTDAPFTHTPLYRNIIKRMLSPVVFAASVEKALVGQYPIWGVLVAIPRLKHNFSSQRFSHIQQSSRNQASLPILFAPGYQTCSFLSEKDKIQ